MDEFIARIGTFFYLIGVGLVILFIASDTSASLNAGVRTNYDYLFLGVFLLFLGFVFRKKAKPPPAAERFRAIRNFRANQKKKQEERAKAKAEKQKKKK